MLVRQLCNGFECSQGSSYPTQTHFLCGYVRISCKPTSDDRLDGNLYYIVPQGTYDVGPLPGLGGPVQEEVKIRIQE